MSREDGVVKAYLQAAHNRGGSFYMAMLMMSNRIEVLEDKLHRSSVRFEPDSMIFQPHSTKQPEE